MASVIMINSNIYDLAKFLETIYESVHLNAPAAKGIFSG